MYLYLQDDATFTITVDGKTFHFQAQDSEERERWIRALEETVLRLVAWFPPFSMFKKEQRLSNGFSWKSGNSYMKTHGFAVIKSVQRKKRIFEGHIFGNL